MDFISLKRIPKTSTKYRICANLSKFNMFVFDRTVDVNNTKIFVCSGLPANFNDTYNVLYIGLGDSEEDLYIPKKYKDVILEIIDKINKEMCE